MGRGCYLLLALVLALPGNSQTLTRQNVANILGFENNTKTGVFPAGWGGSNYGDIFTDDQTVHSGKYSARIARTASSPGTFSYLMGILPMDFGATTIQLSGYIKLQNVSTYVALWMREDDAGGNNVQFASMQSLGIKGTADWAQYSITIPWDIHGKQFYFGFILGGAGTASVDDMALLVDGVPIAQAPNRPSIFDTDHQFDNGSGITVTSLSALQVSNLATLAKVWGFLKYHHPAVTSGQHHWDYELFRIAPQVLAAPDQASALAAVATWIANFGPVPQCTACATLNTSDLALNTNLGWLSDTSLLGASLSQTLQNIYANRTPQSSQFYISLVTGVWNPSFSNELTYTSIKFPDSGYQLLALFRFWNMVEYFYPNREIMADDPAAAPDYWDQVLIQFIPMVALANGNLAYQQAMMQFIAKINDTHANLWSSIAVRPPTGSCYLPVDLQFVQGVPVALRNADGNVSTVPLPGNLSSYISGIGVFYPDKRPAQRVGIIPDIVVRPTIAGIRAGRDEVLERAVREVVGRHHPHR